MAKRREPKIEFCNSDHFFDQVIENNGYTIRSREFWAHMDQVQNIRGLRDEWVPKWTVSFSPLSCMRAFRFRNFVEEQQ